MTPSQPEANALRGRDRATIERIEASFKSGLLGEAMAGAPQIERRRDLSPAEFVAEYRKPLRPVVLEGMVDGWPARRWSFAELARRCGSARVVVDSYNSRRARETTFAEFVDLLAANRAAGGEPIYLQEWLYRKDCPFLAEDMPELPIAQYDFRRNLYGEAISTNHQLWIGQAGATTRLHQDSYMIDVMHMQLVGEKHWCVMSPRAALAHRPSDDELDFAALVADPETRMMTCVLKPGDVLYLPALWWHRVELVSDSIGLGRKCLDEVNLQAHVRLRLAELLALALNHDQVKEAHPELYKVVVLRNQAWAKLLQIDLTKLRP